MKKNFFILSLLAAIFCLVQFSSCRKDSFLTQGGRLSFSTDTLYFDTVFTTMGSVTKEFKIFNRNSQPIKVNNIRLANGSNSFFRLNVDGEATTNVSDVEIAANDSIYVFAAVTVDPNNDATPFVIDDKVIIDLNENSFDVALQAYGQNAHILRDSVLQTQTWIDDLPYVIINSALVDSAQTLTIQKGCRIYMHANSKFFVGGTLNCYGTKEDSIVFQGDRLDRNYFGQDFPGEWRGLHFLSSGDRSNLNHVVIKNGGATDAAVYVQPPWTPFPGGHYMLEMNKCRVENSLGFGVLCFNTVVNMNNCLVHSCGQQNFAALEGGTYNLNNCTFATYGGAGISHINQPVMYLARHRQVNETSFVEADLNANIRNCIIYGSIESELVLDNRFGVLDYNVLLQNCLIKRADPIPADINNISSILNQDPLFTDRTAWDYSVDANSPAKNSGAPLLSVIDDINDVIRGTPPTIGCYE